MSKLNTFKLCEKCNANPGTVECASCYSTKKIVYCYDCDSSVHKHLSGSLHSRALVEFKPKKKEIVPSPALKEYQVLTDSFTPREVLARKSQNKEIDNVLTKEDLTCNEDYSNIDQSKKVIEEFEHKIDGINNTSNSLLLQMEEKVSILKRFYLLSRKYLQRLRS
jgi:hypothetical protein